VDRNKEANEDNEAVLQEGFFSEQNGVAPFQTKTCVAHTVQLKTLAGQRRGSGRPRRLSPPVQDQMAACSLTASVVTNLLVAEHPGTVAQQLLRLRYAFLLKRQF